jgi:hypothetical protein
VNIRTLSLLLLATTGLLSLSPYALAGNGDEIFEELRKQMNFGYIAPKEECIEFAKGAFVRAFESERRFVLGRTISEKEKGGGTERIRVDFVSGPQRGARYTKELDFPQATSRENAVVPEVDPQKIIRVAMSPLAQMLGTRVPFMFLNLYGYLSGYGWELTDGAVGGPHPVLTGRPKSSAVMLPHVELRLDQRGPAYTVDRMTFFMQRGAQKADMYKFSFGKYRRLSPKDLYRPMEVEVAVYFGRRTEVDTVRFDQWLFRVAPSQAERQSLSQLNLELPIPRDSKLLSIR